MKKTYATLSPYEDYPWDPANKTVDAPPVINPIAAGAVGFVIGVVVTIVVVRIFKRVSKAKIDV